MKSPGMHFANGDIANSPQEFVDLIGKEYQDFQTNNVNWGWKTNYAHSMSNKLNLKNPEYKKSRR